MVFNSSDDMLQTSSSPEAFAVAADAAVVTEAVAWFAATAAAAATAAEATIASETLINGVITSIVEGKETTSFA